MIVLQAFGARGGVFNKMENHTEEGFCEIKVKGKLENGWAEWFDVFDIEIGSRSTTISGVVADQSASQGLMEKVAMPGLSIIPLRFGKIDSEEKPPAPKEA